MALEKKEPTNVGEDERRMLERMKEYEMIIKRKRRLEEEV